MINLYPSLHFIFFAVNVVMNPLKTELNVVLSPFQSKKSLIAFKNDFKPSKEFYTILQLLHMTK